MEYENFKKLEKNVYETYGKWLPATITKQYLKNVVGMTSKKDLYQHISDHGFTNEMLVERSLH